jgi:uroporphyrinogen-III synthase
MRPLLILRPEPGNSRTAAAASAAGLEPHRFPLFETRPVAWEPPDPLPYTGIMMTSANAARFAGPALLKYLHLPLFAVGDATAEAARAVGFTSVVSGDKDVARLLAEIATLGEQHILHLCGADHLPSSAIGIHIARRIVYTSVPLALPAGLANQLGKAPIAMLHSPRAAERFAQLVAEVGADRNQINLIAISQSAADAAGEGWEKVAIAPQPRDEALIEIACRLCGLEK